MNDQQLTPSFEESVAQVMQTLPPPIRHYLGQGKYSVVANQLMTKYGLHIDQGGILEREIMLLLMGIENPDEFTQALADEAKLDVQTINNITKDVNDQIFVPLREEMRKGTNAEVKPPQAQGAAASAPPRASVLQPKTTIIPANPRLPPRQPETFAPTLKYTSPAKSIEFKTKSTQQVPTPRQMDSSKLLEDREEPHIEFKKAPSSTADTSLRQVLRAVVPPENLPGVIQPPVKPKPPIVPPPPVKPYSSDPYREPIEP